MNFARRLAAAASSAVSSESRPEEVQTKKFVHSIDVTVNYPSMYNPKTYKGYTGETQEFLPAQKSAIVTLSNGKNAPIETAHLFYHDLYLEPEGEAYQILKLRTDDTLEVIDIKGNKKDIVVGQISKLGRGTDLKLKFEHSVEVVIVRPDSKSKYSGGTVQASGSETAITSMLKAINLPTPSKETASNSATVKAVFSKDSRELAIVTLDGYDIVALTSRLFYKDAYMTSRKEVALQILKVRPKGKLLVKNEAGLESIVLASDIYTDTQSGVTLDPLVHSRNVVVNLEKSRTRVEDVHGRVLERLGKQKDSEGKNLILARVTLDNNNHELVVQAKHLFFKDVYLEESGAAYQIQESLPGGLFRVVDVAGNTKDVKQNQIVKMGEGAVINPTQASSPVREDTDGMMVDSFADTERGTSGPVILNEEENNAFSGIVKLAKMWDASHVIPEDDKKRVFNLYISVFTSMYPELVSRGRKGNDTQYLLARAVTVYFYFCQKTVLIDEGDLYNKTVRRELTGLRELPTLEVFIGFIEKYAHEHQGLCLGDIGDELAMYNQGINDVLVGLGITPTEHDKKLAAVAKRVVTRFLGTRPTNNGALKFIYTAIVFASMSDYPEFDAKRLAVTATASMNPADLRVFYSFLSRNGVTKSTSVLELFRKFVTYTTYRLGISFKDVFNPVKPTAAAAKGTNAPLFVTYMSKGVNPGDVLSSNGRITRQKNILVKLLNEQVSGQGQASLLERIRQEDERELGQSGTGLESGIADMSLNDPRPLSSLHIEFYKAVVDNVDNLYTLVVPMKDATHKFHEFLEEADAILDSFIGRIVTQHFKGREYELKFRIWARKQLAQEMKTVSNQSLKGAYIQIIDNIFTIEVISETFDERDLFSASASSTVKKGQTNVHTAYTFGKSLNDDIRQDVKKVFDRFEELRQEYALLHPVNIPGRTSGRKRRMDEEESNQVSKKKTTKRDEDNDSDSDEESMVESGNESEEESEDMDTDE